MADLTTIKIKELIETQSVATTDYMVVEKTNGTYKCEARFLKGASGVTPNISIGNTNTLPPGQLATVSRRGSNEAPVFDFGIPQGIQGPMGLTGPKGDTPDITPLKNEIDNRFNALTSKQQGDSEVIDARGGYPALKARLDAINDDLIKYNDQTIVTHTTESNFSSIDATKNGYLDNILLEGKTLVVDSNNQVVLPGTQGAMLKSAGDGVTEINLNSLNNGNFIEKDTLKNGFIMSWSTGTEIVESGSYVSDFIKINEGINITFRSNFENQCMFFDINKNYLGNGANFDKNPNPIKGTIKIPNNKNIKYIKVAFRRPNNIDLCTVNYGNSVNDSIGVINTKKVLYKDTDGTWKKPTLRQWDSIEKHSDGKYYYHKRSEEDLFNENCSVYKSTVLDTTTGFNVSLKNKALSNSKLIICNKYETNINAYSQDIEGVFAGGNNMYIRIKSSKANNVEDMKLYLKNNNISAVYKLEQEQVFECTPIDLISYDTQTNYSIECGPIYPKTTLKVNSYLGNVVSILKDKVSYLENYITDGLASLLSGGMKGLAEFLYPQDFVSNVDDSVDMEVIE